MAVNLNPAHSLLPVKGIQLATVAAGIRYRDRDDLTLLKLDEATTVAAVFTRNRFCAAPVLLCREHLASASPRYLLINAGNANAGTGQKGLDRARKTCEQVAMLGKVEPNQVLPFSTGVIGMQLPLQPFEKALPEAFERLSETNWMLAAQAIMTTDTVLKGVSKSCEVDGHKVTVTGIAKGSGMIEPDMATMLAYVATDAKISKSDLNQIVRQATDGSFNSITVDGDTSTNDSLVMMATGQSGISLDHSAESREKIIETLTAVCLELAQMIIRDAEGATKFVTIDVVNSPDLTTAREIAYTVARSPLVKTALFASDPNWGRILAAIGRARVDNLDIGKLSLWLGETQLIEGGEPHEDYDEAKGQAEMNKDEITIRINLNSGDVSACIWTSDLSHDYVTINADYRS